MDPDPPTVEESKHFPQPPGLELGVIGLALIVFSLAGWGLWDFCAGRGLWSNFPSRTGHSDGEAPNELGKGGNDPTSKAVRCETDWSERLLAGVRQYEASVKSFRDAGGADAYGLGSPEQIDERLALLKRMDEDNHSLLKIVRGATATIKSCLIAADWPEDRAEQEAQAAARAAKVSSLTAIRAEDVKFCASSRALFLFLKENWGAWEYDDAKSSVRFDNDDLLGQYRLLVEKINDAANRQKELQAKTLGTPPGQGPASRPE